MPFAPPLTMNTESGVMLLMGCAYLSGRSSHVASVPVPALLTSYAQRLYTTGAAASNPGTRGDAVGFLVGVGAESWQDFRDEAATNALCGFCHRVVT
ncbi:hypothetical protein HC928_15455 [bacterium]|nr:hypothetical protein [bacterium]